MGLMNLIKSAERIKVATESYEGQFLEAYNVALKKNEQETRQEVPTDYFRPSSMYGCKRMLFFMRKGAEQDVEDRAENLIGICDSGTDRHSRIQHIVAKMEGVEILDIEDKVREANQSGINTEFMGWNSDHTEARCKNADLSIFFQPDGVLRFAGKEVILEIKTMSTFAFKKLVEPKEEHRTQATCYAMGLGIDYVLFFYEDRNFTEHKLFLVHVTDEMKQVVIDKVTDVNGSVKANIVPAKEDKCTYCMYKGICKKYSEQGGEQFDN